MKKRNKKILAIAMAAVMLFAVGVTAMAAQDNDRPYVTITLQEYDANTEVTTPIYIPGYSTNSYTIYLDDLGAAPTVFDAVNALPLLQTVTSGADRTWKTVPIMEEESPNHWVPTGDYGQVLNSLYFGSGEHYTNVTLESNDHYYKGTSWMYTVDGEEPDIYMDYYDLDAGMNIVLSFTTSSMEF